MKYFNILSQRDIGCLKINSNKKLTFLELSLNCHTARGCYNLDQNCMFYDILQTVKGSDFKNFVQFFVFLVFVNFCVVKVLKPFKTKILLIDWTVYRALQFKVKLDSFWAISPKLLQKETPVWFESRFPFFFQLKGF